MRKSKERKKIESLNVGDEIKFSPSKYLQIARITASANMTARARGEIKPDKVRYSLNNNGNTGKLHVRRNF